MKESKLKHVKKNYLMIGLTPDVCCFFSSSVGFTGMP